VKAQPEYQLQCLVSEYLRKAHPGVMFLSDVRASLKLTIPQQVRSKKVQADGFACPDMMVFHAAHGYHGMFLELKASSPYRKDGKLKKDEHLESQWDAILQLQNAGYHAVFYWNINTVIAELEWYLK